MPWDGSPNSFEIVGRYIAQTIQLERFLDLILLDEGVQPKRLLGETLAWKIKRVGEVVSTPERGLQAWSDLEDRMAKVARNRNAFAHRMMERGDLPPHYGQGIPYVALSDDELDDQAREAFTATELAANSSSVYSWHLSTPAYTSGAASQVGRPIRPGFVWRIMGHDDERRSLNRVWREWGNGCAGAVAARRTLYVVVNGFITGRCSTIKLGTHCQTTL